MRYISLFSGIEAATVAWEPLGWEPVCFAELDPFPCAVLENRYPDVPNVGDVTKVNWKRFKNKCDVVVGGSPCQSFSVAGKREGLSGESGLMFEYIRAVREVRPRWFLWENVPGALSSEGGEAFRQLLSEMDKLGYGLAWRVLDAQFFGVAQRRRRVFLVGRLGACPPVEVLFEPEGMRGDHPSSREKRKELAAAAGAGAPKASTLVVRCGCKGGGKGALVSEELSMTLSTSNTQTLVQEPLGFKYHQGSGAGSIGCEEGVSPTCTADYHNPAVDDDMCGSLKIGGSAPVVAPQEAIVRRLMPMECERLQGFPDDWTRIPYRGKPAEECPDGPRYKAIGNSFAVPVVRWIGERIAMADKEGE